MSTQIVIWLASGLGFIAIGMLTSRIFRRNDVADVLWGLGFVTQAVAQWSFHEEISLRGAVHWSLVTIWGLRLSIYLGLRTFQKTTEDTRYAAWRREWGNREPLYAFLKVFLLQGLVMLAVTLPIGWVATNPSSELTAWDFLGVSLFLFGLIWEITADTELKQFKNAPDSQGKVLTTGLWGYSRHPNYFGEILMSWGLFFMVFSLPGGAWTILSPLLMTYLLVKVSGVAMLERVWNARGPEYQKAVRSIPALIPFQLKQLKIFFAITGSFVALDLAWLGGIMKSFYMREAQLVARLSSENPGEWDVLLWPAAGVYFCLSFATQLFAVSDRVIESAWKGAILGFCIYGVYDFTNLSLLKNWSSSMAMVDVIWGTFLCSAAAAVGAWTLRRSR